MADKVTLDSTAVELEKAVREGDEVTRSGLWVRVVSSLLERSRAYRQRARAERERGHAGACDAMLLDVRADECELVEALLRAEAVSYVAEKAAHAKAAVSAGKGGGNGKADTGVASGVEVGGPRNESEERVAEWSSARTRGASWVRPEVPFMRTPPK